MDEDKRIKLQMAIKKVINEYGKSTTSIEDVEILTGFLFAQATICAMQMNRFAEKGE